MTSPKTISKIRTKACADSLHHENEQSRRDLELDFYDEISDLVQKNQDNNFNANKTTNLESITDNRNPNSDNELTNKNYVDDSIGGGNNVKFNYILEEYLKVSLGYDTYNLTKNDKLQYIDTRVISFANIAGYLFQNWIIQCNEKNDNYRLANFIKSTKASSPNKPFRSNVLPPIGNSFL